MSNLINTKDPTTSFLPIFKTQNQVIVNDREKSYGIEKRDSMGEGMTYKRAHFKPKEERNIKIDNFSTDIFDANDSYLNENFNHTINIPSKVVELSKEFVTCESLVDMTNLIFENRTYPRILFDNITNLKTGAYALISVKSKAGSVRFDVFKGESFFDTNLFNKALESDELWSDLEKVDFNDPFDFKIE